MRKVYYCSPGGILPKAPRGAGTEVLQRRRKRSEPKTAKKRVLGATDRKFLQTPQDTEPVKPLDWPGGCPQQMEGRGALPICRGGTIPWGWEGDTC